jgi:hypothetical protein
MFFGNFWGYAYNLQSAPEAILQRFEIKNIRPAVDF